MLAYFTVENFSSLYSIILQNSIAKGFFILLNFNKQEILFILYLLKLYAWFTPGVNLKIIHTLANSKALGFFNYVWCFNGHQVLLGWHLLLL